MDHEEKLAAAAEAKERGTKFFSEGKMRLAVDKYKRVVELLEHEKELEADQQTRRNALMVAAHLNMSLVLLKEGETVASIEQCDKVLEINPDNVKALYRRAQARQQQNDDDLAIGDYKRVLELEPSNKAAQQGINVCQHKLAEFKRAEKQKFARMFDKFTAKDIKAGLEQNNASPDAKKSSEDIGTSQNGNDHDMALPSTSEGC
uniref:peptidylprolyl isomerase n=1 Tax=Plectus sambesii TaxID=2011161 RepID=A0A914ULF8_9BILA